MNAEQLNGILSRFVDGHKTLGSVKKFAAVRSSIEAIANEPANAEHQKQFRQHLTALSDALHAESINVFSAREEALIDDLGLRELVGADILRRVVAAIEGQELTPRVAAEAIVRQHDGLQNRLNKIVQTSSGLSELGIAKGEPDVGTVELGLFIPRPDGDLSLTAVLEEGEALNRLVSVAHEVVNGTPESPRVRYLTSSDYGFLLELAPQVVAFLILAVERALALYKGLLETQLLHRQLRAGGTSEALITPLVEESKNKFDADIHNEVLKAIKERSPSEDDHRKNELANQVVAEVRVFLAKAEKGNYLDIRVGMEAVPPEQEGEAAEVKETRKRVELLREVETIARRLHALERTGEPKKLPSPES